VAATGLVSREPCVKVVNFSKHYGDVRAVQDVSLEVRPGEIFGLIGPDGAGKSSLMKAVAGILKFDRGEVEVFGVPLVSERAAETVKDRIGFMPQGLGLNLYPDLTVEENIDFLGRLRLVNQRDLSERKEQLLAITRLAPFRDRAMKNLSGGMKQKLGLVGTLIHRPSLVILDEPTTGVDPVSRRDFWTILTELLTSQGLACLVSTAYLDEASRFQNMALMNQGRVLTQGSPQDLLEQVPGTMVRVTAKPQTEALRRLRSKFTQVEARGPNFHILVEQQTPEAALNSVREAVEGLEIESLQSSEPELEDVFLALMYRTTEHKKKPLPPPAESKEQSQSIAIEATGLSKQFGQFRAADQVNFQVKQGEIFGLLGANGAGKTTVIKMLTGILAPSSGNAQVAGADMTKAGRLVKERIGYVSQAFSLYLDLTVIENIQLYATLYGLGRKESKTRSRWVLDLAGLGGQEDRLAGSLPMGMRQRLALGCALVHKPRVLFLDEPTSGVDPIGRRLFWDILFRLSREDGVAILVTTHYMSEAEHCDHLVLMFAGKVVADASPEGMKEQVEQDFGKLLELTVDDATDCINTLHAHGFEGASLFGSRIHLMCSDPSQSEAQVRALLDVRLRKISPKPLSMEDVFVALVSRLEQETTKLKEAS